jgi:DMSO/TMAO reductase YedYZ molybdopterin-dependent catalytic subunit
MARKGMETGEKETSVSHCLLCQFWRTARMSLAILAVAPSALSLVAGQEDAPQVEIREYQGERLGSASDFRENSIRGVQVVDQDTYVLTIDGLVGSPALFSYAELWDMPHADRLVTIYCVEGWSVKALWTGIPLVDLLARVEPSGHANTVIFHAADGYTTSLPLDVVIARNLILADRINGLILPAANGFPFQLVAEDKWGYKWIKWVTWIELSDDAGFRGFWESRGFSDYAEIDNPFGKE